MTWSILAHDPETGALGAAVASRFFAVGALCIQVEGTVGAIAVQALTNPSYFPAAWARLRNGEAPQAVLDNLVDPDPGRSQRQFHMIDGSGRVAQHTGDACIGWAGMVAGAHVSVAGNMLAGVDVVARTRDAYLAARGSLVERLLTAMEAGEAAGGDKRGKQSAGLIVCHRDPMPVLDIRSDDHPDPLADLRRLYRISLERYAIFRRHLAGRDSPWGTLDRAIIDAEVARDGLPPA